MAKDDVDEAQVADQPEPSSDVDSNADLENADQDTVDSRDDAVAAGQEAAKENVASEAADQPDGE